MLESVSPNASLLNYPSLFGYFLTRKIAEAAEAYLWLVKDSNVTGFTASSEGGLNIV